MSTSKNFNKKRYDSGWELYPIIVLVLDATHLVKSIEEREKYD